MSLLCFGISHRSAPLSLVETLSFRADEMALFLKDIAQNEAVHEAAGLSTCNRSEFYLEVSSIEAGRAALTDALTRRAGGAQLSLQFEHGYWHEDADAARHLFRVASGVDSMVVGERQVLGQARDALELATASGTAGRVIKELFQKAIATGRRSQLETNIGRGRVSVASLSVVIAQRVFSDLPKRRALVVGAGQTGKLAAQHLRDAGVGSIIFCNRTEARAEALAASLGGQAVPFARLGAEIPHADIVVCATGATEHVLTVPMVGGLCKRRATPVVMLDLSLPRNIDPECAEIEAVFLYAIEDLEDMARENRAQREAEIALVEEIVREEAARFCHWYARTEADMLVAALRRRVEDIRRQHLARYGEDLDEAERDRMDIFTDSLLRGVLHDLTANLRAMDLSTETGRREFELVCRLFNISPETLLKRH